MGTINQLEVDIAEGLGVSPAKLLESLEGFREVSKANMDEEWTDHTTLHAGHPSVNCPFCVQDADVPDEEEYAE